MRLFTRTAIATALALGVAAPAMAQFTGVYFFGDSLSDAGSYKPVLPPGTGLFTTNPGPIWVTPFAQTFGFTATPANQGGNAYAMGGAYVTQSPGYSQPPGATAIPVSQQIQTLIKKGPIDGNAIYSVWAGNNEVFQQLEGLATGKITAAQAQANMQLAAVQLAQQVGALRGQGANYIMVWNLPDIGNVPQFVGTAAAPVPTALSGLFNSTLTAALDASGIPVIRLNDRGLLNEITANPSAFGFTNARNVACTVSTPLCTPSTLVSPNAPQTYVFADGVHPSTAGYAILAQYAASVVLAPQQIGVLAEAPLATEQANWRALDGRMFSSINTRPVGKFEAWAAYDYTSQDFDGGYMTSGDASLNSVFVGGDIKLSPHLIAGMMGAYTQNKGDYGSASFKLNQATGTVYVGWGDGPWYAGATLGASDIDYSDIDRDITLGALSRTESGTTGGYTVTGRVLGGYWFTYEDWLHGPTAKWTYQDVKVRAYQEQGANSTTMSFNQQDRNSSVLSLGWQTSGKIANVRPYAKVLWEYELEDGERNVEASVYGMGGSFSMPVYKPDSSWFTFNLGAAADFGKVTGYLTGSASTGKNDGDYYAITLGVRIPM